MASEVIINVVRNLPKSQIPLTHLKCRCQAATAPVKYQTSKNEPEVSRLEVPDDKVKWTVQWPEYETKCVNYTAPIVKSQPVWADPENPKDAKWNAVDGNIDRRSHHGEYEIIGGLPRNPVGRTGIRGRGLLGKWGPNHAADPIVTRWKTDSKGQTVKDEKSNKSILEFVCIKRLDTDEWAIPGGMCDPGEKISQTLKREFMEEALNSEEMSKSEVEYYKKILGDFFNGGEEVYRGYCDDPRNTDNSWMETIAYHFHDENGSVFKNIKLHAGDDAKHVKWMPIGPDLKLYASHREFVRKVAEKLNACS